MRSKLTAMLFVTAALLLLVTAGEGRALAQCAMCRAAVNAASNGANFARSFNTAVLVLLAPPVTIFCSIFIVAYKHRQARREDEGEQTSTTEEKFDDEL